MATAGAVRLTVPAHFVVEGERLLDPYLGIEIIPRLEGGELLLHSPDATDPRLSALFSRLRQGARRL